MTARPLRLGAVVGAALMLGVGCASPARDAAEISGAPTAAVEVPAQSCLAVAHAQRQMRPAEPAEITARHILVKHTTSKSPKEGVVRDRGQACLRAIEARDQLRGGASFDGVVADFSDERGAATRGGTLGAVRRADVVPAFGDAAFELDRGQLSDVVETEFGFHVILRAE